MLPKSLCFLQAGKPQSRALWLSGRVLDSRPMDRSFKPHWRHCVVCLNKSINPSLELVQPRKTCPYITERLLMGRKESNQTNKSIKIVHFCKLPRAILVCVPVIWLLEAMLAHRKNNNLTFLHANNIGADNFAIAHKLINTFDVQSLESQCTSL